jgi:hypothetical protein
MALSAGGALALKASLPPDALLMKKPGALRNGAPFKDLDLPPALTQVRIKLKQHADGDRQFVKVLARELRDRLALPA